MGDSMDEVFDQFFGPDADGTSDAPDGENTPNDLRTTMEIDLETAFEGAEKRLRLTRPRLCPECNGTGRPTGDDARRCPECDGEGQTKGVEETPLGRVEVDRPCSRCDGDGVVGEGGCSRCDGDGRVRQEDTLTVQIPAGIEDGQTLRMDGEGVQTADGPNGDLYVEVAVTDAGPFDRDGADLHREVTAPPDAFQTGGSVDVEGVDSTIQLQLPSGTDDGETFRAAGRGMPKLRSDGRGDLYVTVRAGDERRQTGSPPEEVPAGPDASVAYDDLSMGDRIGSGGNADVVRATAETGDGEVSLAVKRPRLDGTLRAESVDRVLDEAETWDRLDDHGHVVGVVDYGSTPVPWIAMEYMDGGHLGERTGAMPTERALWTAVAVAEAVHYAHRRGVAHLDLKPENVLFRSVEGAWDVPKVADWGLSKHLLDRDGDAGGLSPQYAAPEQFDDARGPTDDLTDVYQLGAVLYELFTGRPPFDEAAPVSDRVADGPPDPRAAADVPDEVADVVTTAMAPERDDRYDSAVYVRDRLRDAYRER